MRDDDRVALRDDPFAELEGRRVDVPSGEVDDRAGALDLEDVAWRYSLPSVSASATSLASTSGCRLIRSNTHASVDAVVSWPAASSVSSSSAMSLRDIAEPSS